MMSLDGEIHVYRVYLNPLTDEAYQSLFELLDEEEQSRATRIRHRQTQCSFAIARASLRVILARYLSIKPGDIRLVTGAKGKPRLAGTKTDQGLVFNVTHSGDCGLIACARDTALGVDVESHRPMKEVDGIAERCFSVTELAAWRKLPSSQKLEAFFALWSFKEAFAKATGEGITMGLQSCTVDRYPQPRFLSVPSPYGQPEEWRLVAIDAGVGYSAGICYRDEERKIFLADSGDPVNLLFNDVNMA